MINYGRHLIDQTDVADVVDVLNGDWLTQGPVVERFEESVAEYVGARYAVAFSNGTAALDSAVAAAGLRSGHAVVTSPLTSLASANAARFVGAQPSLIDIDPTTVNIDLNMLPSDRDAVIPVHVVGLPVDLASMSRSNSIVIEDAGTSGQVQSVPLHSKPNHQFIGQ